VIRDFPGNYTDFREWEEDNADQKTSPGAQAKVEHKPEPVAISEIPGAASPKLKASYKQKQEFKQLNDAIAQLEAEKATITNQITLGTPDVSLLLTWTNRLQAIDGELEELELSWLEMSDLDGIAD
jgi:ATP-binding cassette subfamily F protein uup